MTTDVQTAEVITTRTALPLPTLPTPTNGEAIITGPLPPPQSLLPRKDDEVISTGPTPPHPSRLTCKNDEVISTGATNGLIVRRAVERSPYFVFAFPYPRPTRRNAALTLLLLLVLTGANARAQQKVSGAATYTLTKQLLAAAPQRFNGSPGHAAAEKFIADHFLPEQKDHRFEVDTFTASTPAGYQTMHNLIVRFPGKKDGMVVLASHYETNYPLKDIPFVGANDGACTSALLIEIGQYLRSHPPQGYGVTLVFDDGEEAVANPPMDPSQWTASTSLYGTRHLAAKWSQDGTLAKVKAFIVVDMVGDRDLNFLEETQSADWLRDLFRRAAAQTHHTANVYKTKGAEEDDHLPFLKRGVPVLDMIDVDYGPRDARHSDGWHHTVEDTIDKVSPQSLQISADILMALIPLIDQH